MGCSRDEIEQAFGRYREAADEAGRTGDWRGFVDRFTDDVHYVEHLYGTFEGKQAVLDWVGPEMAKWPVNQMRAFPWDWYTIDVGQGWVLGQVANIMAGPGDGRTYRAVNWTRLLYAGGGLFSEEEDVYNPSEFATMVQAWMEAWRAHHPGEPPPG